MHKRSNYRLQARIPAQKPIETLHNPSLNNLPTDVEQTLDHFAAGHAMMVSSRVRLFA